MKDDVELLTSAVHLSALRKEIGLRLRGAMKAFPISQNGMARVLGVSSGTVSGWVNGRTQPSLEQFAVMCHLLQASANDILGITAAFKARPQTVEEKMVAMRMGFDAMLVTLSSPRVTGEGKMKVARQIKDLRDQLTDLANVARKKNL